MCAALTSSQQDRSTPIAVFSAKPYDIEALRAASDSSLDWRFLDESLSPATASLAEGCRVVSPFVHDDLSEATIERLAANGVELIAMRCAGVNNVHLGAAQRHGLVVARVPAYSPFAVAEHCVGLILSLNRKIHRAHNRVREQNFSLDGLQGFDLHGRTIGIVGTGKIGAVLAQICHGLGMTILAADPEVNPDCEAVGVRYVELDELLAESDIISLHCPLTPQTHHLIDADRISAMKTGVMLINTSRGALIDTRAVIDGLKSGKVGYLGLDVYEEEESLFFNDHSTHVTTDDTFARLLTFPNVLITGHQAFFTADAISAIAATTVDTIRCHLDGRVIDEKVLATE